MPKNLYKLACGKDHKQGKIISEISNAAIIKFWKGDNVRRAR